MTALLIIATAVVLGIVLLARVPGEAMWAADLTNFAHGPAFAVVTVLLFKVLRSGPTRQSPVLPEYLLVTLIALALGAIVELVQGRIGRDASFDDLVRDAQGILAALGFLMLLDPKLRGSRGRRRARYAGLLLGLTGVAMLAWPLIVSGLAYRGPRPELSSAGRLRPTTQHLLRESIGRGEAAAQEAATDTRRACPGVPCPVGQGASRIVVGTHAPRTRAGLATLRTTGRNRRQPLVRGVAARTPRLRPCERKDDTDVRFYDHVGDSPVVAGAPIWCPWPA